MRPAELLLVIITHLVLLEDLVAVVTVAEATELTAQEVVAEEQTLLQVVIDEVVKAVTV